MKEGRKYGPQFPLSLAIFLILILGAVFPGCGIVLQSLI